MLTFLLIFFFFLVHRDDSHISLYCLLDNSMGWTILQEICLAAFCCTHFLISDLFLSIYLSLFFLSLSFSRSSYLSIFASLFFSLTLALLSSISIYLSFLLSLAPLALKRFSTAALFKTFFDKLWFCDNEITSSVMAPVRLDLKDRDTNDRKGLQRTDFVYIQFLCCKLP